MPGGCGGFLVVFAAAEDESAICTGDFPGGLQDCNARPCTAPPAWRAAFLLPCLPVTEGVRGRKGDFYLVQPQGSVCGGGIAVLEGGVSIQCKEAEHSFQKCHFQESSCMPHRSSCRCVWTNLSSSSMQKPHFSSEQERSVM